MKPKSLPLILIFCIAFVSADDMAVAEDTTPKIFLAIASSCCHGWCNFWVYDLYENHLLNPLEAKLGDRLLTCHHNCTKENINQIIADNNPALFVWIGGGRSEGMECDAGEGLGGGCILCRDELGLEGRVVFINCESASYINQALTECNAAFGYWTEMSYSLHDVKYDCDYFAGEVQSIHWYGPYFILMRNVIEWLDEGYTVKESAEKADTLYAGFLDWVEDHSEVPYGDEYGILSNLWSSLSSNIYGDPDATITKTGITQEPQTQIPRTLTLHQNYPNPFNPTTMIKFDLPQSCYVTLVVYDLIGEEVAMLVDKTMESGYGKEVRFDASDIPSGIYFCRLTAGDFVAVKKMILMK